MSSVGLGIFLLQIAIWYSWCFLVNLVVKALPATVTSAVANCVNSTCSKIPRACHPIHKAALPILPDLLQSWSLPVWLFSSILSFPLLLHPTRCHYPLSNYASPKASSLGRFTRTMVCLLSFWLRDGALIRDPYRDYDREVPLYDALRHGCTSVEADVYLVDGKVLVSRLASSSGPCSSFQQVAHNLKHTTPERSLSMLLLLHCMRFSLCKQGQCTSILYWRFSIPSTMATPSRQCPSVCLWLL